MNYSQYDEIAKKYDHLFADEASMAENREVGEMLPPLSGSVLDVGCGTGLLTEIAATNPSSYTGVDPSKEMLLQFSRKHPEYVNCLVNKPCEPDTVDLFRYDNIIALFGSPSYLSDEAILSIAKTTARKFLMFYKADYHPVTYEKCAVEFKHNIYTREILESYFGKGNVTEYHNYHIVNCV